jgi:hypothetical protein
MATYKPISGTNFPITVEGKVPLDLPNILGQRPCPDSEVEQALNTRGGYNRNLFRPPFVIAVKKEIARAWLDEQSKYEDISKWDESFTHGIDIPLGIGGNLTDYALMLFDGRHRSKQIKLAFGTAMTTFPSAMVYFVDSVELGNELFNEFNDTSLTKVKAESKFINAVLANVTIEISKGNKVNARHLESMLEDVGAVVTDDNFVVPRKSKNDTDMMSIGANPFKKLVDKSWHPDWNIVKETFDIYKEMVRRSKSRKRKLKELAEKNKSPVREEFNNWLMSGLATLLRMRPGLLKSPEPRESLVNVLITAYDYKNGKDGVMIKALMDDAISNGDLSKEARGVNSNKIWAMVFASAYKEHASNFDVTQSEVDRVIDINNLWDDMDKDAEARKIAKAKMRKVA